MMNLVLSATATVDEAVLWLQQLIRDFGLGFHLDSAPADYVRPDGTDYFTPDECALLNQSLDHLFLILGEERPYDVCADVAFTLLAESQGLKPPAANDNP